MGSLSKAKKKNIPKSVHEMSKEMLQETLKKKRECNAKALEIVEKLCETCVDEDWFIENLQFINQCHFEDITIERSISKICGYPLCDQQLKNVPAQQYHISVRYNKVFDITERKYFCSSCCYKSAMYVKKQLFTSPLWFRDQEIIPKYTILKSSQSSLGEQIVFFPEKIKPEPENATHGNISNKSEVEQPVKDLENKYSNLTIDTPENVSSNDTKAESENVIAINISNEENQELTQEKEDRINNLNIKEETMAKNENSKTLNGAYFSKGPVPKSHERGNPKKTKPKSIKGGKTIDGIIKVEKSVFEWFSLETLYYLFGEEKLRELFCDKADEIKKVLSSKLSAASAGDKIDRMIKLYGILDTDAFSHKETKMCLKPIPDYAALKAETNTVQIKVKAFYQGQLEMKQSFPEEKEKEKEKEKRETNTASEVVYLPFVDAHAHIPLRRKILLDKLNRVLTDLINVVCSNYTLQMNAVRNLVTTFTLAAHNITFKPCEWYLVGIIMIKLLSLRDAHLESVIKLETSKNQISLILSTYNLQPDYLENLLPRLTDSKNLIKKLTEINI